MTKKIPIDGCTAVADIAYRVNEICAIYPITPSSNMAESADEWAEEGRKNIWGEIPMVQEMQSEGGAAGTTHGCLQSGALTTTFTASQGLLLMIPNMYKIAGELTSTVFHVAARALATSSLSIFGDHTDVMSARMTGFALFSSANVQEAHDFALISQVATLKSRVPFLHFFDGFRTSHEINTIDYIEDDVLRAMIDDEDVFAHRKRGLNPENPFIRGTAQNPDTFFQTREAVNRYYDAVPHIVEDAMDRFAKLTGRHYKLFEYHGDPNPDRIVIIMGSGAKTVEQTVTYLNQQQEKVGIIQVRLFRPFSVDHLLHAIPKSVKAIAVLEQTKEIGANGEPLYQDVITALANAMMQQTLEKMPRVIGGRYGISNKDFMPSMVKAIFEELNKPDPKQHFTVGIIDDVTHLSLDYDKTFNLESNQNTRAVFYGLGADGTVGANKNSVKIIVEDAGKFAQGYFVYDSYKSGSQTISHLRFGDHPIDAPYLIEYANFVACHKYEYLLRQDTLKVAAPNAVFLLSSPYDVHTIWDHIPRQAQAHIIEKNLKFYVIDASQVALDLGLGLRINTILQTCFFAISGVLPRDEAIQKIKDAIRASYGSKGDAVVQKNFDAVDSALHHLKEVTIPQTITSTLDLQHLVPKNAPEFVRTVTAKMFEAKGNEIPVSLMPADGTFPSGTSAYGKRNISEIVPEWRSDLCVQCGQCSFVCPHAVIRSKYYHKDALEDAPNSFRSAELNVRGYPETRFSLQIYIEDCTGCELCVKACPVHSPIESETKALNMVSKLPIFKQEQENIAFFETLPVNDRALIDFSNVRGNQFLEPLFEFSGACSGCGETPYLSLVTRLFGDRMQVANATGCSSIFGGNLPTTPWSKNHEGRGPAWSNSLFEDNAEFGLGYRLAADKHLSQAYSLLQTLASELGDELVASLMSAPQTLEADIRKQRERVAFLKQKLEALGQSNPDAKNLLSIVDYLIRRSIWIIGGDGWAYDIGYGGLDHVLATGKDVNILVLDTEVYSNTGGQSSKATPLGAVAKFATSGKTTPRKDLAMQAMSYGNVYVAQIAFGANPQQTLQAFREAEAYNGTSIILAYAHCIAHGIEMEEGLTQQHLATTSGYWPLFRYNPELSQKGQNPFRLDSAKPSIPLEEYAYREVRYSSLAKRKPEDAKRMLGQAQAWVNDRYRTYEDIASRSGERFTPILPFDHHKPYLAEKE